MQRMKGGASCTRPTTKDQGCLRSGDPTRHPSIHPFRGCSQTPGCRGENPGKRRPSLRKSTGGSRWAPDLENPASTATDLPKGEVGRRICKQTRKQKSRTQETKAENRKQKEPPKGPQNRQATKSHRNKEHEAGSIMLE
ncbi:hypothetical protein SLEP1_g13534 [Rubroshorea leprosula]|uniref:Uncharacterized protein n=1 Tax=Rubroshorea leprosula TaxID=152421 RepID=A0AAV5IMA9_9ROSI|nr:hypothetical protein SLEP1_g13534 [Rubroshorea leprosula]